MAQLPPIPYEGDIVLNSPWTVTTGSNGTLYISSFPEIGSQTVTFTYNLPNGSEVKSAKVHSKWTSPLSGFANSYPKINGISPSDTDDIYNGWTVDVEINPAASSVDIKFSLLVRGNTDNQGEHYGASRVTDVYLLIEYSCGTYLYRAEGDTLVPHQLYRAENNQLVPYQLFKAKNDELVQY